MSDRTFQSLLTMAAIVIGTIAAAGAVSPAKARADIDMESMLSPKERGVYYNRAAGRCHLHELAKTDMCIADSAGL